MTLQTGSTDCDPAPVGSLWLVRGRYPRKKDDQLSFWFNCEPHIKGCSGPYISPWSFTNVNEVVLPLGAIVTIGKTVSAEDMLQNKVVEIISPLSCYVNEVFFSRELGYFERVI